jgi:hypothetical protein
MLDILPFKGRQILDSLPFKGRQALDSLPFKGRVRVGMGFCRMTHEFSRLHPPPSFLPLEEGGCEFG